jgi:hypothetical protein
MKRSAAMRKPYKSDAPNPAMPLAFHVLGDDGAKSKGVS